MGYSLHVVVGHREIGTHEIPPNEELILGRESSNDIVVPDRSVSRKHARVRLVADGIELVDLGSANGLFSKGQLHKRLVLNDGEVVSLGMVKIRAHHTTNHTGMIPISGILDEIEKAESEKTVLGSQVGSGAGGNDGEYDSDIGYKSLNNPNTPDIFRDWSSESKKKQEESSIQSKVPEFAALEKDRLAMLLETGKSLGQSGDLQSLLNNIMDQLFQILPVRRAVVALTDDGENFEARVVRPVAHSEELSSMASSSILKRVIASQEGTIIEDASLDQKLKSNQSIVLSNIRAAVCAPILFNNRCLGAIYLDFPGRARLYRPEDLDFLTAFASLAAVSLENAKMTDQLRRNDRLKRDLEIAAEIQQGLLPIEAFDFDGLEIDWAYWPSAHIGGDFYDVTEMDDGRVAIVLGDVSGKSVPAALYMARTLSFLRATVGADVPPGDVLTRTNELLGDSEGRVLFATTFLMYVDVEKQEIEWANAGHNPVLVRTHRPEEGEVKFVELGAEGPPLGVVPFTKYASMKTPMEPGMYVTLYTDGLVEARNKEGQEYGLTAVKSLINHHVDQSVATMTQAMVKVVASHTKDSTYIRDDVAILNIRVQ